MATVEQALARLQRSAFRAKFHLSEQDRQYIADKGMETIQRHAADFVRTRLAPAHGAESHHQTQRQRKQQGQSEQLTVERECAGQTLQNHSHRITTPIRL